MKTRLLVSVFLITPFLIGCNNNPKDDPKNIVQPMQKSCDSSIYGNFCTFKAVNEYMVKQIEEVLSTDDNLQVINSDFSFDVGTVIQYYDNKNDNDNKKKIGVVSYDSCQVTAGNNLISVPSLFPSITISKNAAAGIGLGEGVISSLAQAGVDISGNKKIAFSVKDTNAVLLSDEQLIGLSKQLRCKKSLSTNSAYLVRGYVQGQRSFEVSDAVNGKVNLGFKLGSFNVSGGKDNSVKLTDSKPERFIMFISAVKMAKPSVTIAGSGQVYRNRFIPRFEKPIKLQGVSSLQIDKQILTPLPDTKIFIYSPVNGTTKILNSNELNNGK